MEQERLLNEIKVLKQRMDILFSENFGASREEPCSERSHEEQWHPLVDIFETQEEWIVRADLPGVSEDNLQVQLLENKLTVEGERDLVAPGREFNMSKLECPSGRFSRTFVFPINLQRHSINADLKRGVLTIVVPKKQTNRKAAHKVEIRSE